MKIGYDISPLGLGHHNSSARTGIFRVIENVLFGLDEVEECELYICSSLSLDNLSQVLDYWTANKRLSSLEFLTPGFLGEIYHKSKIISDSLSHHSPNKLHWSRAVRKGLRYSLKLMNSYIKSLPPHAVKKVDLFHATYFPIDSSLRNGKTKFLLTVYDLIPILYPHFFDCDEEHSVNRAIKSLSDEDWIICISHATKNDLCNHFPYINPDRVFVAYPAASNLFYKCGDEEAVAKIQNKYRIPRSSPYILSLSTLEPRKNIDHTIRCFAQLVQQEHLQDLHLVLVGTKGWDYDPIFSELSNYQNLADRIIITGYVADEDLAPLYSGALAFVYPSFYEGFGLPPLEAMKCGVPVITSNTSSLPEVVGDAGIMVAPTDTDALCQSLLQIYNNPSLRADLSQKSLCRASEFSWDKCVQQTVDAYKMALSN